MSNMFNKRAVGLAVAALGAGVTIYLISSRAMGYLVFDLLNISLPPHDLKGFTLVLIAWFFPLAAGMLASFLIAYCYWRKKS
jgi:hypothetical protein